jgi:BirA family biotin operon repressor/biotin-[acetyl-CoA-carboxylase] ligase
VRTLTGGVYMIGNKIIKFTTLDSTNKYIKENIFTLDSGTIVITDFQTDGYGRLDRKWFDNNLLDLTFSFVLKQKVKPQTNLMSQLVGAALIKALEELEIDAEIKWPNDILINSKKVAGILVESKIINDDIYLIIGIGLNVNSTEFDQSILNKATSLKCEANRTFKLDIVLHTITHYLNYFVDNYNQSNYVFLETCREKNALYNKVVTISPSNEMGKVIGIDNDGSLIVLINNKKVKYFGSEISLSNSYNGLGE